jgi:hypothetical protein
VEKVQFITGATEEYDGSIVGLHSNSMITARGFLAGAGTQTAGLAFGGYDGATFLGNNGRI